jgi:transcriptional regulator with XRE-family HTH domain
MGPDCPTNLSKEEAEGQTNLTSGVGNNPEMAEPTKKLLARAVTRAIDAAGVSRNSWSAAKRLDVKAVERVEKASHNVGVDFMDKLARAIGVEPWQLIHPDERMATMSELALEAARKLDAIKDPSERARAYALWVQVVEFANRPPMPEERGRDDESSTRDDPQPRPGRPRGPRRLP